MFLVSWVIGLSRVTTVHDLYMEIVVTKVIHLFISNVPTADYVRGTVIFKLLHLMLFCGITFWCKQIGSFYIEFTLPFTKFSVNQLCVL